MQGTKPQRRARFGAFLKGVDQFDPGLFGVTSNEAELMDPQQRVVLEVRTAHRACSTPISV